MREYANREILEQTFYSSYRKIFYRQEGKAQTEEGPALYGLYWRFNAVSEKKDYNGCIDSMMVNGVIYYNIRLINKFSYPYNENQPYYYWVKGVGPIKFKADSMVWELQNYYINI